MLKKLLYPLTWFAITLVYFYTRLVNLLAIPVFVDEAIYLRWSQLIKNVETLRFIPLTDGKQPLFMWLTVPFLKIFTDPLFAGRFLSILAGFGILITLYLIFYLITNNPIVSFLPSIIYLFTPFSFFFDRLSLPDNLLSFFITFSLLFTLLLIKHPHNDIAIVLGAVLGLSWLTKSPTIYFVVLSSVLFIISNFNKIKTWYLPVISSAISYIIYNILRLGPQFHMIASRNLDYVWPVSEIIKHPFDPLVPHIFDVIHIYWYFIGPIIIFLLVFVLLKKYYSKDTIIIFFWWLIPLVANCVFAKVFTSRYILYSFPPLIILFSVGVYRLNNQLKYPILVFCLLFGFYKIYQISFYPFNLTLPSTETGYLNDWTSGWGIKPISQYLIQRSAIHNIIVGTEGTFGTLPDGLAIYLDGKKNLTTIGVGLKFAVLPDNLVNARKFGDEVYLVINDNRLELNPQSLAKLTLVNKYPKPDGTNLMFFRFN